jgi:hypothetical protein
MALAVPSIMMAPLSAALRNKSAVVQIFGGCALFSCCQLMLTIYAREAPIYAVFYTHTPSTNLRALNFSAG